MCFVISYSSSSPILSLSLSLSLSLTSFSLSLSLTLSQEGLNDLRRVLAERYHLITTPFPSPPPLPLIASEKNLSFFLSPSLILSLSPSQYSYSSLSLSPFKVKSPQMSWRISLRRRLPHRRHSLHLHRREIPKKENSVTFLNGTHLATGQTHRPLSNAAFVSSSMKRSLLLLLLFLFFSFSFPCSSDFLFSMLSDAHIFLRILFISKLIVISLVFSLQVISSDWDRHIEGSPLCDLQRWLCPTILGIESRERKQKKMRERDLMETNLDKIPFLFLGVIFRCISGNPGVVDVTLGHSPHYSIYLGYSSSSSFFIIF